MPLLFAKRERAEIALKSLRASVADSKFATKVQVSDSRMPDSLTTLANLQLTGETDREWALFYPPSNPYGGDCFRIATEDRLGYLAHVEAMLESLRGQCLTVRRDTSWRWDTQNPYESGRPRYVPHYALMVSIERLDSGVRFNPAAVLAAVRAETCAARDARADEQLFDYQQERGVNLFSTYKWTPTGFKALSWTKAAAERLAKELFGDCRCTLARLTDSRAKDGWQVDVEFPA